MGISMVEFKEKLEKAYNDENWSIIEELLETLSYEIENGEGLFEQYKDDEEEDLWGWSVSTGIVWYWSAAEIEYVSYKKTQQSKLANFR